MVAMPSAHPLIRVQIKVDIGTYTRLGISLKLRRLHMSKKGKLLHTPKLELLCDTGAQVDCISRKTLLSLGLGKDQLRKPQILLDCANKTEAEVLGVFFGEVLAMEGNCRVDKVKVLFYEAGLIDEQFPKVGGVVGGWRGFSGVWRE